MMTEGAYDQARNQQQAATNGVHNREAKPAKLMSQYFSLRAERRRQGDAGWEAKGDEDLIGDVKGKFGLKRVFWKGSLDSQGCPTATSIEIKEIFRHCIRNLGAYGNDMKGLTKPIRKHELHFDSKGVVDLQCPTDVGACPPYFIYVDHEYKEVSMYIRGLNLLHRRDYVVLFKNRKGDKPFDEGFVHHGMFEAADWTAKHVAPILKEQLQSNQGYRLTIVGHSLGAGVAGLFTMLLVRNPELVGLSNADNIRSFLFAPPRVMSIDLTMKYATHINSVIYQDDFLPRVSTKSVKHVFFVTVALNTVVVFIYWLRQTFQSKQEVDTERLYPPGKVYHFVYKQPGRRGKRPIRARVVPSAKGRFERLVLPSVGTVKDHSILLLAKHLKKYEWPKELKDPWLVSVLQTKKKKRIWSRNGSA
jgi:hypothetical protein